MKEWLLEFLECSKLEIRISKRDKYTGEPYSGVIRCGKKTYFIKRGIAILIDKSDLTRFSKLRGLYEALPEAPWKASRNDWIRHMRILHLQMMRDALLYFNMTSKKRINILAVGCGWGWELWALELFLKKLNFQGTYFFVGIDIANKPLRLARRILIKSGFKHIDFAVCPAEKLPFKEKSFDIVTGIFGAFDHSEFYYKAFLEVSRILTDDGVFIFTALNKFALDWIIKVLKNPALYYKTIKKAKDPFVRITIPLPKGGSVRIPTHYYNPLEIYRLMKLCGLKIIRKYGIFSILPMNFRRREFTRQHIILSKMERCLSNCFPISILGRYMGVIAKKDL